MVKSLVKNNTGYTGNMYDLIADIKCTARFIATLVRLNLVPMRVGQILASDYGQQCFDKIRNPK